MKNEKIACLIEDDPVQIFLVTKLLEISKKMDQIWVFKNGKEAYDELKSRFENLGKVPDLILLDINMPIWDGWEFLKEFKALPIPDNIKIYILTSSLSNEDFIKAEQNHLENYYIKKPINLEMLNKILDDLEKS